MYTKLKQAMQAAGIIVSEGPVLTVGDQVQMRDFFHFSGKSMEDYLGDAPVAPALEVITEEESEEDTHEEETDEVTGEESEEDTHEEETEEDTTDEVTEYVAEEDLEEGDE